MRGDTGRTEWANGEMLGSLPAGWCLSAHSGEGPPPLLLHPCPPRSLWPSVRLPAARLLRAPLGGHAEAVCATPTGALGSLIDARPHPPASVPGHGGQEAPPSTEPAYEAQKWTFQPAAPRPGEGLSRGSSPSLQGSPRGQGCCFNSFPAHPAPSRGRLSIGVSSHPATPGPHLVCPPAFIAQFVSIDLGHP